MHQATGSPIAVEALERIGGLYALERVIRGRSAEERQRLRHTQTRPVVDALKTWLEDQLVRVPPRGGLAEAIRYALARWPGLLVEYYGMTEGGGTCVLVANQFPDKLHTVGVPVPGHDIRLIDDEGREVARGETGEVVGRSPAMMSGYHGRKQATAEAEWFDAEGNRFIRHGDVGRFDEDGFLILMDRKKDNRPPRIVAEPTTDAFQAATRLMTRLDRLVADNEVRFGQITKDLAEVSRVLAERSGDTLLEVQAAAASIKKVADTVGNQTGRGRFRWRVAGDRGQIRGWRAS